MTAAQKSAPLDQHFGVATLYRHPVSGMQYAKIFPGKLFGTRAEIELVTLLGSCIATCIRDPIEKIGGMNHFMVPGGKEGNNDPEADHRYAQSALDALINNLVARGATMGNMEVKLFGGGNMLERGLGPGIGEQNIAFAEDYFAAIGLPLQAKDVGKHCPRKVHFNPLSGTVHVKRLTPMYRNIVGLNSALENSDTGANSASPLSGSMPRATR